MDPKFRSSFIPKKPLDSISAVNRSKRHSINLFSVIGISVFIIASGLAVALFSYQFILEEEINQKGINLKEARDNIDLTRINNLRKFEEHVETAQMLLNNHVALSTFFEFLNISTLKKVQFEGLEYGRDAMGMTLVSLHGTADGYNSLVLQSDVFRENEILANPQITEIALDEVGRVKFLLMSPVHPDFIHYNRQEDTPSAEDLLGEEDFTDTDLLDDDIDDDIQ